MAWVQRLPFFTSQLRIHLLDLLFSILAACLELLLIAVAPTIPNEATVATILGNVCRPADQNGHRAAGDVVVMDGAVILPPKSPKSSSSPPPVSRQYSYSPLLDDHIRIIRILPHGSGDAPIECEIQHHSLIAPRKGPHPYEALSYVWGSPEMPYRAYTPTGYIPLTQNLHSALRRLRDTSLPRVLWVDAVCINQTNTDEREAQVRRMAEIYARGSRVVIWLEDPVGAVSPITAEEGDSKTGVGGENTDRSADALEILGRVANGESLEVLTEEGAKSSLLDLFQRSWFSRIWVNPNYPFCVRFPNEGITSKVLQEVAAARNILVVCQSSEIDGHAFYKGVITLSKTQTLSDTDERTKHRVRSVVSLMDGASLRPRHINLTGATFSLNSRSLGELIDIYTDRDATDQRDLVYALLGMADDVTAHFSPDYNITWRSLFGQVVRWISGSQSTILAWNGKQTAFLKCPIQAIGYVTQTEGPIDSWDPNAAQLVWVRWTDDFKSCGSNKRYRPNTEDAVKCHVSTNPVQEADIICFIQGRIKPSIVRVFDDYCRVISMVVELPESFTAAGSDRIKAQERLWQIISPYQEARLVWQWGGSQCDVTSTPSLQSWFPNCPDLESAGEGAEESKAARLESTGLLLAAAYLPRAIDLLEKAIAGFEAVGGKDDPRRQNAIYHLMSAYDEWFHKGAIYNHDNMFRYRFFKGVWDGLWFLPSWTQEILDMLVSEARFGNAGKVKAFLDRFGQHMHVNAEILRRVVGKGTDTALPLLDLLLERWGDAFNEDLLKLMLERYITSFFEQDVGNPVSLATFLSHAKGRITITRGILLSAAKKSLHPEVINLLMDMYFDNERVNTRWEIGRNLVPHLPPPG